MREQSRAVAMTAATRLTSGCARAVVTRRSQRRRATLHASRQSLNFGGHIDELIFGYTRQRISLKWNDGFSAQARRGKETSL